MTDETMEPRSRWMQSAPLLIAIVAVFIRLAALLRSNLGFAYRLDDSLEYLQLAAGMRHGCGFARLINGVCQSPEILRTPGYPLFISIMPSVRWSLAMQAILGGIVCLLVARWVERSWDLAAAIVAECFIAFDLTSVVMSSELMSEVLFQFALVLALVPPLLIASRPSKTALTAVLCGIAAGFAILVRPIGILLPILLPFPFFFSLRSLGRRRRLVGGVLAFAVSAVILLGWSLRNYDVARFFGVSTVSAIDMYYYRAADIVARRDGILLAATRSAFDSRLGVPYQHIYEAGVQSPELTRRMNRLGMQIVMAHPIEAVTMTLQGALYLALSPIRSPLAAMLGTAGSSAGDGLNAGAPSLGRIQNVLHTMLQSPALVVLVLFEILLTFIMWIGVALAVLQSVRGTAEYRLWTLYLSAAGIILLVVAAGGEADARFRAPVIPLLAIVAGLGYFPSRRPAQIEIADAPANHACSAGRERVEIVH